MNPSSQQIPSRSAIGMVAISLLTAAADPAHAESLTNTTHHFTQFIRPILKEYCITCHSTEKQKGDLDLERFQTLEQIKGDASVWEHALEQIRDKEMPPKDKPKPSPEQLQALTAWMQGTLDQIALDHAGDPGPVVLRRLSNMEYTYSVRDLTGLPTLDPAREFPVDGAAGEGFTNAGAALVMSPSLLTKYLDAAKSIASHAVLTPEGIRFSEGTSSRDWTNEILNKIRAFYSLYSTPGENHTVVQQGVKMDAGSGGRLPLARYLAALQGKASAEGLSVKYLHTLRSALTAKTPSLLIEPLRQKFEKASLTAPDIEAWTNALWKLNSIGHLGKVDGPKSWMEAVTPLTARHEVRLKLQPPANGGDLKIYLSTGDAGDGNTQDFAIWENPRLVLPGLPDLGIHKVRAALQQISQRRAQLLSSVEQCLAACDEAQLQSGATDTKSLALKHGVSESLLTAWLNYLGIRPTGAANLGPLLAKKLTNVQNYNFVGGWAGEEALSVIANSSDQTVKIPGTLRPHSVALHPSPKNASVIAWKSPVDGTFQITGTIQHVHAECGNGVTWTLQLRHANIRETLASGQSGGGKLVDIGEQKDIRIHKGDAVVIAIGSKDGNHTCDLTAVNLVLTSGANSWNLAKELSPDILAGNPHPDQLGNRDVWHFFSEPEHQVALAATPPNSLITKWQRSNNASDRAAIAAQLSELLKKEINTLPEASPERALHKQLLAVRGPLLAGALNPVTKPDDHSSSPYGIHPSLFGKHPDGTPLPENQLCVKAPNTIELQLPPELAEGAELVAAVRLHDQSGPDASVQMWASTTAPSSKNGIQPTTVQSQIESGAWTSSQKSVSHDAPILVHDGSEARERFESAFADFRSLFPAVLCYQKIVPSDEVVTLTLFHREDEPLMRLMLEDFQKAELNRLWEELHFVSEDALTLVDAFEQLWQFSTQDGPDKPNGDRRLAPLREPIAKAAEAFKTHLLSIEPRHVQASLDFAARAWRRPLTLHETKELTALYHKFRTEDLPHSEAIKMLIARALVAPAFLYKTERPPAGDKASPVNDWELASRLSYFLWSGPPDQELLEAARGGSLKHSGVLLAQTRRMIKDSKVRRLATEFGCQWLHIRDLDTLDEKSERHFPTFAGLRGAMQEESVRFFIDLFQENRSILSLLDADHSFLNGAMAKHYGIETPVEDWQRVDGLRSKGRGGVLGFAATLSKQSGASRTSPILRGNWLSEVVLGEKLPRPPKGVPLLPEETPQGLTERQLIERHSSDPVCANCHKRIDPLGFALEGFDAIGRARTTDAAGLAIDTKTQLPDGTSIEGLPGLREQLVSKRKEDFLRQFSRKLLGYALGRSIQLSDRPLLNSMLSELAAHNHSVETAIETVVTSPQFREIRGRDFKTLSSN